MVFEDKLNVLYKLFYDEFCSSEGQWNTFLNAKNLGLIVLKTTHTVGIVTGSYSYITYKITDPQKWFFTKIKYGI